MFFFFIFYLFMIVTEKERQRHRQREAGSMHREPDVGIDPGSPGSRPRPKAGAKPLRHLGIPAPRFLMYFHKGILLTIHSHPYMHIYSIHLSFLHVQNSNVHSHVSVSECVHVCMCQYMWMCLYMSKWIMSLLAYSFMCQTVWEIPWFIPWELS